MVSPKQALVLVAAAASVAHADPCASVDAKMPVTIATAAKADEYALAVTVASASATSWGEAGNEAIVLDVSGTTRGFIGHLIVHQGKTKFEYTMHVGALAAGEQVQLAVSKLSARKAAKQATACDGKLAVASEDVRNAPEFRWPVQKAFDDVPLLVGWSQTKHSYETVMTNEDGGTAESCGGGAAGMQAEIARWGRSTDIEDHYHYGEHRTFERCSGRTSAVVLAMEAAHPILYWGNGHNRLFEDRSGYGRICGENKPEKSNGDIPGWGAGASGDDAGKVIVLRPLPVDLDALGYARYGGRREALADHYAPWMYRLASLELAREGKIDGKRTFAMDRYLYVDVRVSDVGGEGGTYCALHVHGGFKLHVHGKTWKADSAQITAKFAFGGHHDWKRVAVPLPAGVTAADVEQIVFDAYDNDGAYVTGVGDAFIPHPQGDNGATLDYVRKGETPLSLYVDDDSSGCSDGVNVHGPGGSAYHCAGSEAALPLGR